MNDNKNTYNLKEVENKLHNFQEGKDYFVTPSQEPEIKDYTFYNDRLKSMFGGNNWVPVRVWQEKFDGKDVRYRGHFEEGKDYRYSTQHWNYEKDYQGDRGIEDMPYWLRSVFAERREGITSHSWEVYGEAGNIHSGKKYWEKRWVYKGKKNDYEHKLSVERNHEPKKIDGHSHTPIEGQWCCGTDEVSNRRAHLESWKKDRLEMEQQLEQAHRNNDPNDIYRVNEVNDIIATLDQKISEHENWLIHHDYNRDIQQRGRMGRNEKGSFVTNKEENSDLAQENQELRQQLASVQAELSRVLAELKKLTGKGDKKLEQQQAENEKAINQGSVAEIKAQVQKSQALMREAGTQTKGTAPEKNKPENSALPYLIGGSLLAAGLGGVVYWWKKHSSKK